MHDSELIAADRLRSAAPGAEALVAEDLGTPGHRLPYVEVGAVAYHLAHGASTDRDAELRRVFEVAETILATGDDAAVSLIWLGFLESLQNTALNHGIDLEEFLPYLGPRGREAWDEIIRFWRNAP